MMKRLILACLLGALAAGSAQAASLQQIQYRLHQDSQADVEADLRVLASRGDRASMQLLADLLAGSADRGKRKEATALYQAAFANGQGQLGALVALANLSERLPNGLDEQRAFFSQAVQRFPATQDLSSVHTSLDLFLVYPELYQPAQVRALLDLHQRACLETCAGPLYRARLAEQQGQRELANNLYLSALRSDARAVERYYQFLGEEQDDLFPARVKSLLPQVDELPVAVVLAIGSLLSSIPREHDPDVIQWLDNAIARQAEQALVSKANYMMSAPQSYSAEEVFPLIERIELTRPQEGRALRASAYLVRTWRSLDPFKAEAIIQALLAEGYQNAYLNLGELYSMGGLDQVDQTKAIASYRVLAARGVPSAFYRIATLYGGGKGICHDKVKAYAYAKIAVDNGELGARKYLKELAQQISPQQLNQALQARNGIISEIEAAL
jgi:alginate biosynthesis protein AlgK